MCSINFTQPGEQEVIIGKATFSLSTKALFNLWSNSVPSSIIVTSAAKSVSKTASKPNFFKAFVILPVTCVPTGKPKVSPKATRTEGAVLIITCFLGSPIASQISS